MCQCLSAHFRRRSTQDLLHRPEARVVETFCEGNNVGRHYMLILLVGPRAAGKLIRLNGGKVGKVE